MPKFSDSDFRHLVDRAETELSGLYRVQSRRPIPYGTMLELAGGGNVILYNGKKGVSGVVSGQVTEAERRVLESFLAERGWLPGIAKASQDDGVFSKPGGGAVSPSQVSTLQRPPLLNLSGAAGAWIGSDEAGKGDYFGPLVVAAVAVDGESHLATLAGAGVRDSKTMGNAEAERLADWIQKNLASECVVLMPEEYNRVYGGNLNVLLGKLHARVLAGLAARTGAEVCVTDQFARPQLLTHELRALDFRGRVFQRSKGEADGAVAAASVLARGSYLRGLRELSSEFTVELTPGAGPPVLQQGRELVRLFGAGVLEKVGKLHFKTSEDILGGI